MGTSAVLEAQRRNAARAAEMNAAAEGGEEDDGKSEVVMLVDLNWLTACAEVWRKLPAAPYAVRVSSAPARGAPASISPAPIASEAAGGRSPEAPQPLHPLKSAGNAEPRKARKGEGKKRVKGKVSTSAPVDSSDEEGGTAQSDPPASAAASRAKKKAAVAPAAAAAAARQGRSGFFSWAC